LSIKIQVDRTVIEGAIRVSLSPEGALNSPNERWAPECWRKHAILIYRRGKGIQTRDEVERVISFLGDSAPIPQLNPPNEPPTPSLSLVGKVRGIALCGMEYAAIQRRHPFLCGEEVTASVPQFYLNVAYISLRLPPFTSISLHLPPFTSICLNSPPFASISPTQMLQADPAQGAEEEEEQYDPSRARHC